MYKETRSSFSSNLHCKIALIVIELTNLLPEQIRNMPRNERTRFILATIHEHAFLLGMCMKIDKQETLPILKNGPFGEVYLGTTGLVLKMPNSIQIIT
jgi:hypothetical protein